MIEIEKYNCNDGNEARARERYWFEELQAKLNTKAHAWLSALAPVNALLKQAEDAENAGDLGS
jgi:hypothetical protein